MVLVERLEGHGIERVTPGGIVIPATAERRPTTKADTYRARVLAVGPEAARELTPGTEVIVHTWHASGDKLYSGVGTDYGTLVALEDIVCALEAA